MKAELTGGHHSNNKHQYMDTLTLYLFTYHYALILTEYMSPLFISDPPQQINSSCGRCRGRTEAFHVCFGGRSYTWRRVEQINNIMIICANTRTFPARSSPIVRPRRPASSAVQPVAAKMIQFQSEDEKLQGATQSTCNTHPVSQQD